MLISPEFFGVNYQELSNLFDKNKIHGVQILFNKLETEVTIYFDYTGGNGDAVEALRTGLAGLCLRCDVSPNAVKLVSTILFGQRITVPKTAVPFEDFAEITSTSSVSPNF